MKFPKGQRGYTLIELSLVLISIFFIVTVIWLLTVFVKLIMPG